MLATLNPRDTADWIESHLEHAYSHRSPIVVARRWGAKDVQAAFEWTVGLLEYEFRTWVIDTAYGNFLKAKPGIAKSWIRDHGVEQALSRTAGLTFTTGRSYRMAINRSVSSL